MIQFKKEVNQYFRTKTTNRGIVMTLDWQSAYDQKLKELSHNAAVGEVMNCIWEHGILAHVSPDDPDVFAKRKEENRPVWRRDDPILYWRILYAAHGAIYSCRQHYSLGDSIVTWPVALACMTSIKPDDSCRGGGEPGDPFIKGAEAVIQRAESELRKIGEVPHRIPFGARGEYKGIRVAVERCDNYGRVVFGFYKDGYSSIFEESEAWQHLHEVLPSLCAEPMDLNPAHFITQ